MTAGKDALAEVVVRVRRGDAETTGQAASTDSVEAALKAYVSAVGSVHASDRRGGGAPRAGGHQGRAGQLA